ncbi:YraN family protein [Collinsella provencensis]|uniref:YraN family protein n=1 Tax=Collinsella provencensis TaxID=1937461 RepID=UPI000C857F91|nr:YraN family protein [Collinsella provencensis]
MGRSKNRERAHELLEALLQGDSSELGDEGLECLPTQLLGALGEEVAAWYLEERGYVIVERNYRCPEGEADIVVLDEDNSEVVLVEVKTRRERSGIDMTYPEEAVTPHKRQRYRRIAHYYAAEHYPVPAIRFDVIAVCIDPDQEARTGTIHHICRAFDWEAER